MKTALVTGANRGIGKETSLQLASAGFHVILMGRNEKELINVKNEIEKKKGSAEIFVSDVTDLGRVLELKTHLEKKHGVLDVLVNNAGVFLDDKVAKNPSTLNVPPETVLETFEINVLGPYNLIQTLLPLLEKSESPRVVNVSSGMGGLTEMAGGSPAYRISKTALNALTKTLSKDLGKTKIKVNSVCPGWVKTDMGGPNATRSLLEGAKSVMWAATLDKNGPNGGFFRDGKELPW